MKKKQAPKKQTSKTVVSKAPKLKATPKVVSKNTKTASKSVPKKKIVKTKSKCILFNEKFLIIGIIVLVVLILLTLILTLPKLPTPNENEDTSVIENTKIDVILTEEEIEAIAQELQIRMANDLIDSQKKVFETWYEDLELDKEQMDVCYLENDFSNENFDFEKETHILKLMQDTEFAQMLGFMGTPGIYINSYKLDGFVDLGIIERYISMALDDEDIEIDLTDLENFEFETDATKEPILTIIYNEEHILTNEIVDSYLEKLMDESFNGYFENMFSEINVEKIDYREERAQEIMKGIMNFGIPLFYLEGDLNSTDFFNDDMFLNFFYPIDDGYILYLPEMQNLGYKSILQDADYIIGDKDAPVTLFLFTSYDCSYCKLFEEEVVDYLMDNYVSEGLLNIIVKDFVGSPYAITPAIFSRCAQEQGKYYETHRMLFEKSQDYTGTFLENLYSKYDSEIEQINEAYSKLYPDLETQ